MSQAQHTEESEESMTKDRAEEVEDEVVMLTTFDNPFNPKEDYIKWKQFDEEKEYFTEDLLARIADIPSDVDSTDEQIIEQYALNAIEEIVEHDVQGIYKKI